MHRTRGRHAFTESVARALGPCRRAVEARTEAERREREANERLDAVIAFREQLEGL